MNVKRQLLAALRSRGRLLGSQGLLAAGLVEQRRAAQLADELFRTEPDNTEWMQTGAAAQLELAELALAGGRLEEAGASIRKGCELAGHLRSRDSTVQTWGSALNVSCLRLRARMSLRTGNHREAEMLAAEAARILRSGSSAKSIDGSLSAASIEALRGEAALAAGREADARAAYVAALAAWPRGVEVEPRRLALRVLLLRRTGRSSEAQPLIRRLAAMGYRHPDYVRALKQGV